METVEYKNISFTMLGVVGMLVFTQYWYWFPLSHFLSLAFQPTAVIGLNSNLDMPVVKFKSNAKPSMYGYPPNLEEKKKEDKEKVTTAVLSITNKQKKKEAEKRKGKDGAEEEKKEEEKKEPEPLFEHLSNPARVMKAQLKVINLDDDKYRPIKDISIGGIVMLDRAEMGAEEEEQIVEPMEVNKGATPGSEEEGEEPAPPEPFQWTED